MCGVEIRHRGNEIVSIRGDDADPFSRGHICPKALALKDVHEDPDRLRRPVRREGDTWREISWDEALDETAKRLLAIQRAHGSEAVASYFGNPQVHSYSGLMGGARLLRTLRSRNRYSATSVDQLPHHLVSWLLYGHQLMIPIPDLDRTQFLLVLGAAMALSSVSFRVLDFGHGELKFIADFGFGGMFLFGSVLAVVMTAQLFFSEMDNKTALTLLAKPLGRGEFLLGKFAGAWAVLGVFVAVLSVLLGVVLWAREQELLLLSEQSGKVPPTFSASGLAQFALLQWLRLGVVASIVLAISAVARTFLYAVVVGALAVVAGQLQWIAQDAFLRPTDSPAYAAFLWVSTRLIPNLQQFNLADALVLGSSVVEEGALISVGFSGLAYLVAYLTLGSLIFRRREI